MLCLFLRLPYRRTTCSKRKANKPLAIDKDQRSTPCMYERASELQSVLARASGTNWSHKYETMARTTCLAKSPRHETPRAFSRHCLKGSNPWLAATSPPPSVLKTQHFGAASPPETPRSALAPTPSTEQDNVHYLLK